jgi:hypothetical protein
MGGSHSSEQKLKGVFSKELNNVNFIVNSILTDSDNFQDPAYDFMDPNVCSKYTMVLESKLSKYLKVHLHDLNQNIYFVPKTDQAGSSSQSLLKKDICELISTHYAKTLKILSLIKEIYDLENGGDLSIAGIIYRNLKVKETSFEVSYCGLPQEPITNGSRINFKQLKGLDRFVNDFLTESEAKIFVSHLRNLFGNTNKKAITKHICEDTLISLKTYQHIYEDSNISCAYSGGAARKPHHKQRTTKNHLMFSVDKNKPIISYETCFDKQKIEKPYSKRIKTLFDKFRDDYVLNIQNVVDVVNQLVYYDKQSLTYKLRDLTHDEVEGIQTNTKRLIIVLFVQSLVNYFKILNHFKKE